MFRRYLIGNHREKWKWTSNFRVQSKWSIRFLFTDSILKGLKELTEFGYVTQVPVQLLTIPRNPRNIVDLNMLSDEEEGDDDVLLFYVCFQSWSGFDHIYSFFIVYDKEKPYILKGNGFRLTGSMWRWLSLLWGHIHILFCKYPYIQGFHPIMNYRIKDLWTWFNKGL